MEFIGCKFKKLECRGRDSNPRRATPLGPQPSAFDRSTTPADQIIMKLFEHTNFFTSHYLNVFLIQLDSKNLNNNLIKMVYKIGTI
jgi:hypothetical protein